MPHNLHVRAYNDSGDSAYSNIAKATTKRQRRSGPQEDALLLPQVSAVYGSDQILTRCTT